MSLTHQTYQTHQATRGNEVAACVLRPSDSEVARDLLGKVLVHERRGVRTSGLIVEVEACIGESDPACHAAGPTRRNEPMAGEPGHAYVYLNYGIHPLVNVVTESAGSPAAVHLARDRSARRRRRHAAPARAFDERAANASEWKNHRAARSRSRSRESDDGDGDYSRGKQGRSLRRSSLHRGPRHRRGAAGVGKRIDPGRTEQPWRAWVAGHPAVVTSGLAEGASGIFECADNGDQRRDQREAQHDDRRRVTPGRAAPRRRAATSSTAPATTPAPRRRRCRQPRGRRFAAASSRSRSTSRRRAMRSPISLRLRPTSPAIRAEHADAAEQQGDSGECREHANAVNRSRATATSTECVIPST